MKSTIKTYLSLRHITMFVSLFLLLAMHAPADLFTPYLWAEDGVVLISGAIYNGIKALFIPGNGAYWVIQKLLAWLCYLVVLPFNSITALPYLQQIAAKALATLSILYFTSEKFSWVLKDTIQRFFVCVAIVLLFPKACDVVTCETSLPFYFVFPVFLIGLDVLCSPKAALPSVPQTIFMSLFALSSAAAPFVLLIVVAAAIRAAIVHRTTLLARPKTALLIDAAKIAVICIAVWLQLSTVLSSERTNTNLELLRRAWLTTKYFLFIPYLHGLHGHPSWVVWLIGLVAWLCAWKVVKVPCIVLLYSGAFSWGYVLLCSMVGTAHDFYSYDTLASRYGFACYEIAAFVMALAIVTLLNAKTRLRSMGIVAAFLLLITALRHYDIPLVGAEFAAAYKQNSPLFDRKGTDRVFIPIGPWSLWEMSIPASISDKDFIDDIEFLVETTNGAVIGSENYGKLDFRAGSSGIVNLSGWARTGVANQTFSKLLVKSPVSGAYRPATFLRVRSDFHGEPIQHNGFTFMLPKEYFSAGTSVLEVYGKTADGAWHHGSYQLVTELLGTPALALEDDLDAVFESAEDIDEAL